VWQVFIRHYNIRYSFKCSAGADVYTHADFIKVNPISEIQNFLIYRLPNQYIGVHGISEITLKSKINELLHLVNKIPPYFKIWDKFLRALMAPGICLP